LKKCKTKLLKGSEHLPYLETVKVQSFRPVEEEIVRPVAEEIMRPVAEESMIPVTEEIVRPVEEEIARSVAEESMTEESARPVEEESVREECVMPVAEEIMRPVEEEIVIPVAEESMTEESVREESVRPVEEEIVRPVAEESMREESVREESVRPVEEESVREESVRPVEEERLIAVEESMSDVEPDSSDCELIKVKDHSEALLRSKDIIENSCDSVEVPVQGIPDILQFDRTRIRESDGSEVSDDFTSDIDSDCSSAGSESENSEIFVKCSKNVKGRRVFDKLHYCMYCDKSSTNLSKHILNKHKTEDYVQEALRHPTKSYARKMALEKCRNLGDFHHNCEVIKTGKGQIIPWRSPPEPVSAKEYVPCPCCYAFFQEQHLWRHHKECKFCIKADRKHSLRSIKAEAQLLLPTMHEISSALQNKVFSNMNRDECSILARNDRIITKYGEKLLQKHSNLPHLHAYIRTKMKELARLVACARRRDKDINWLSDCLDPSKFETVLAAVRETCGFSTDTNSYRIPSLALKLGHALKKCCAIEVCSCIKNGNSERKKRVEDFLYLCEKEWTSEVSSAAISTLTSAKMNRPQVLPLTDDIMKMNSFLNDESTRLQNIMAKSPTSDSWNALARITLVSTVLFNRRRSGEAERMLLANYENRRKNPLDVKDIADALSETERFLCRTMTLVEIRGKRGRTVPVILTPKLMKAIDCLIAQRGVVGVPQSNLYVFARTKSNNPQRASDCLRLVASQCGADQPNNLTSTRLRKHIASTSQILNLQKHELDLLAGFLGHNINVHRTFYRLPQDTLQLAKVSKILMAFDNGQISQYKGKSLDEIDVNFAQPESECSSESDTERAVGKNNDRTDCAESDDDDVDTCSHQDTNIKHKRAETPALPKSSKTKHNTNITHSSDSRAKSDEPAVRKNSSLTDFADGGDEDVATCSHQDTSIKRKRAETPALPKSSKTKHNTNITHSSDSRAKSDEPAVRKNSSLTDFADGGDEDVATCSHQDTNVKKLPTTDVHFRMAKPPPSLHLLNMKALHADSNKSESSDSDWQPRGNYVSQ
jgi:hypothetical protein